MAEIKINVNLSLSRRRVVVLVAALLALWAVPQLGSENLTLSTYYPAPAGVYASLITTMDAFLGRDGGTVSIGDNAAAGPRLTVMNGNVGIGTTAPSAAVQVTGLGGTNVDLRVNGRMLTGSGVFVDPAGLQRFGSMSAPNTGTFEMNNNVISGITVGSAGNVGIGGLPASGRETLDVNGDIVARAATLDLTLP